MQGFGISMKGIESVGGKTAYLKHVEIVFLPEAKGLYHSHLASISQVLLGSCKRGVQVKCISRDIIWVVLDNLNWLVCVCLKFCC